MPRLCTIALTALSASLLISCERTAQPVSKAPIPKAPQVAPQSVSTDAEFSEASDSDEPIPNDSLVVSDTTGTAFTHDDFRAVKSALEARLRLDEFTASGPATPYGKACRFYDTTSVRRYTAEDVRYAFVRPRVIKIAFGGDDHYVRLVNAAAEITRVAVLQRDVDGKWQGAVNVTRDTLSFVVSSSVSDSVWRVCEKPAHSNGWNGNGGEKPVSAWLPVRAPDAEQMAVAWDEHFTIAKLRQLADSVSKLPSSLVVEGNPEPKVPIVYKDVCPGEGCAFGEWLTCDTLRVFTNASDAKTAFVLRRGDKFSALTGDVHIKQAGMVVFNRNTKLMDEGGTNYVFTPADTLYPLLYAGEGYGSWYFRGKEGGGLFFFGNGESDGFDVGPNRGYTVVRPINSAWWVKVRTKDGREGWFVPGSAIYGMAPHYEPLPNACPTKKAG